DVVAADHQPGAGVGRDRGVRDGPVRRGVVVDDALLLVIGAVEPEILDRQVLHGDVGGAPAEGVVVLVPPVEDRARRPDERRAGDRVDLGELAGAQRVRARGEPEGGRPVEVEVLVVTSRDRDRALGGGLGAVQDRVVVADPGGRGGRRRPDGRAGRRGGREPAQRPGTGAGGGRRHGDRERGGEGPGGGDRQGTCEQASPAWPAPTRR